MYLFFCLRKNNARDKEYIWNKPHLNMMFISFPKDFN